MAYPMESFLKMFSMGIHDNISAIIVFSRRKVYKGA